MGEPRKTMAKVRNLAHELGLTVMMNQPTITTNKDGSQTSRMRCAIFDSAGGMLLEKAYTSEAYNFLNSYAKSTAQGQDLQNTELSPTYGDHPTRHAEIAIDKYEMVLEILARISLQITMTNKSLKNLEKAFNDAWS
jgi:hypothetical protein